MFHCRLLALGNVRGPIYLLPVSNQLLNIFGTISATGMMVNSFHGVRPGPSRGATFIPLGLLLSPFLTKHVH